MVSRIKIYKTCFLAVICMIFLEGCTELGDIVAVKFFITNGKIELKDFDGDYISKENLGASPHCLTRRSVIDKSKWMGVCVSPDKKEVVIYRAFNNNFEIEKNGITKEVLDSNGYQELSNLTIAVEAVLDKHDVKFKKSEPNYMPFKILNEELKFTR